ncbi:hypothetical protein ACIQZO_21620 [Streptomyces sp. NPDC097617]|uniref:hypothetical protein n=1 Tax=Streptomyces sp. NPDC097617 TaxID=3366091 RepID=UPI003824AEA7
MRLRSTAAVIVGALALALPTAGPSLADDHGERALGTLHYTYLDAGGAQRNGQIRPADNDTCYLLTRTSRDEPAIEVRNDTESLAVLFDNRSCEGEAEAVLKPGGKAKRVEVVSVYFKPVVADAGNGGNGGNGTWPGRGDQGRDDESEETPIDGGQGGDGGNGTWPGRGDQGSGDESGQTEQPAQIEQPGQTEQPDQTELPDPSDESQNEDQNSDDEEEEDFVTRVLRALG